MQPTRHPDRFVDRHIGPDSRDIEEMLAVLAVRNLDELIDRTVPASIRLQRALDLPPGRSEFGLLREVEEIAAKNRVFRSYIGMGYSDTVTPPVIQRNILENPGWYTQYTPYQPEISQGRLEALLNYQTMDEALTGRPRRGLRGGIDAAVRRPSRLRRAARGVLRDPERVRAQHARPDHRRLGGRARPYRLAHGAADARAAHPPGEGDQQHLHGAGAA